MDSGRLRFVLGLIVLLLLAQCIVLATLVEPGGLMVKCAPTVVPFYLSGPLAVTPPTGTPIPQPTIRPAWAAPETLE